MTTLSDLLSHADRALLDVAPAIVDRLPAVPGATVEAVVGICRRWSTPTLALTLTAIAEGDAYAEVVIYATDWGGDRGAELSVYLDAGRDWGTICESPADDPHAVAAAAGAALARRRAVAL